MIYGDFKIGDASGGIVSMNRHSHFQQDWDLDSSEVSCVNGFINIYTLSQCNKSSSFNEMGWDVENGDVSGEHSYINSHTLSQHNGFRSLINSNNSDYIEMNGYLKNCNVSCGIVFINSHTIYQSN